LPWNISVLESLSGLLVSLWEIILAILELILHTKKLIFDSFASLSNVDVLDNFFSV